MLEHRLYRESCGVNLTQTEEAPRPQIVFSGADFSRLSDGSLKCWTRRKGPRQRRDAVHNHDEERTLRIGAYPVRHRGRHRFWGKASAEYSSRCSPLSPCRWHFFVGQALDQQAEYIHLAEELLRRTALSNRQTQLLRVELGAAYNPSRGRLPNARPHGPE